MKRLFSITLLALSLASFPLVTGMTCSPSQQRVTYDTLYSLGAAVNAAYAAWNDQVVAGKAKFDPAVATRYSEFQALFAASVASAKSVSAPAPPNVKTSADAVNAAIAAAKKG